ncbi:MAG: hypothetical protein QOD63_2720, partial [Actinomycetota bacterium]|nr:hypothetical protein [Actinomycetota bacterium]
GLAAWTGVFVSVLVLLPGPAVRCGGSGVATGGPWWMHGSTSTSSVHGAGDASSGISDSGDFTVGDHQYAFACDNGQLVDFRRVDVDP